MNRPYLQDRAAGIPRAKAAERHGITTTPSGLVGVEWQALTYAGATVWGVHQERDATGAYKGGAKRRPRAEWVIQDGTHEALITREEAEILLARLEAYRPAGSRPGKTDYLLTGLLVTPGGAPWHVDGGGKYYRTKGRSVNRQAVDQAVLGRIAADLRSPEFVAGMLEASKAAARSTHGAEIARAREELDDLTRRVSRFMDMAGSLASPGPVLRKVDEIETERERVARYIGDLEEQDRSAAALSEVTAADVHRLLDHLVERFEDLPAADLRALLAGVAERIELDPSALTCAVHYRVEVSRSKLASPRGFEPRLPP